MAKMGVADIYSPSCGGLLKDEAQADQLKNDLASRSSIQATSVYIGDCTTEESKRPHVQ